LTHILVTNASRLLFTSARSMRERYADYAHFRHHTPLPGTLQPLNTRRVPMQGGVAALHLFSIHRWTLHLLEEQKQHGETPSPTRQTLCYS
jgi:hypothetical protein